MDAKARLEKVRADLEQRGVRDVKFFLTKGVSDNSCVDVATKVADFLEGYLNGSFQRVNSFGDAPQAAI